MKMLKLTFAFLVITICIKCSESPRKVNAEEEAFVSEKPTNFEVDPFWPKRLPNNWILGDVAGIAVDENDHVWIVQRPGSLHEREKLAGENPRQSECCVPAPSVLEFDADGNFIDESNPASLAI